MNDACFEIFLKASLFCNRKRFIIYFSTFALIQNNYYTIENLIKTGKIQYI